VGDAVDGSARGAASEGAYPFRFYGHGCEDWIEGGSDGHTFTVRFARAPSEDELERLATRYEEFFAQGPVRPAAEPWEWSGAFALFSVGERGRGGSPVWAVTRFLREAHEIVPLVDVVYFNAREGTDAWDDWSVAQGPPSPGPFSLNRVSLFIRERDPALPDAAPDPRFERARRAVRRAGRSGELDALLAKEASQRVHAARVAATEELEPQEETPAAPWTPEQLAAFDIPEPAWVEWEEHGRRHRRRAAGDHLMGHIHERPIAYVALGSGIITDIAWLDRQGRRRTPQWPEFVWIHYCLLHPEGRWLFTGNDSKLYRVDLDDGVATAWWAPPNHDSIADVALLAGGTRLAVASGGKVHLLDTADPEARELSVLKRRASYLYPVFEGRALLLRGTRGHALFALVEDRLKRAGATALDVPFYREVGGEGGEVRGRRLLFGGPEELFELVGAAEAVAALVERKPKTKRAGTRRKARKPKLTFAPLDGLPEPLQFPPEPAFTDEERARFPDESLLVRAPDGGIFAAEPVDVQTPWEYRRIFWSAGPGQRVELTAGRPPVTAEPFWQMLVGRSGRHLYVRSLRELVRVTLDPFATSVLAEAKPYRSLSDVLVDEDEERCILLGGGEVRWLDIDGDGRATCVATVEDKSADWLLAYHRGLDVVVAAARPGNAQYLLRVYLRRGEGAVLLGRDKGMANRALVSGERIFVALGDGSFVRELAGLAEVVAHRVAARPRRPKPSN